jgi:hypothetical protein
MPNWCQNILKLEHDDPEFIRRAHSAFAEGKLLNEFVPVPDDLANPDTTTHGGDNAEAHDALRYSMTKKYGYSDWYSFRVNEWGTKWDVGDEYGINSVTENSLFVTFDSAWAPPVVAYEKMSKLGFRIDAQYCEEGIGFVGRWSDENGDEEFQIPPTAKEIVEKIPADLDDMFCLSENRAISEEEEAYDSEDK